MKAAFWRGSLKVAIKMLLKLTSGALILRSEAAFRGTKYETSDPTAYFFFF